MGRKFSVAHVQDIRPCVTGEDDLLAWFGEPFLWGNENGFQTMQWSYLQTHVQVGGSEPESDARQLVVVLNHERKVVRFSLNPACVMGEVKDICAISADASAP
jgi:hypothetical protein